MFHDHKSVFLPQLPPMDVNSSIYLHHWHTASCGGLSPLISFLSFFFIFSRHLFTLFYLFQVSQHRNGLHKRIFRLQAPQMWQLLVICPPKNPFLNPYTLGHSTECWKVLLQRVCFSSCTFPRASGSSLNVWDFKTLCSVLCILLVDLELLQHLFSPPTLFSCA